MPRILPILFGAIAMMASTEALTNKAHERLSNTPIADRNKLLAQVMAGSGEPCGQVTKSFFQGMDKKGTAFWNVACSNTKSYSIMINDDATGSTKILDCSVLKAVANVQCFKKF